MCYSIHTASVAASLAKVPLFKGLQDDAMQRVAGHGRIVHYDRSAENLRPSVTVHELYVVLHGALELLRYSSTGRCLITAWFGPGDVYGLCTANDAAPLQGVLQVAADDTHVFQLSMAYTRSLLRSEPAVLRVAFEIVCRRAQEAEDRLALFAFANVNRRLIATLLQLSEREQQDRLVVTEERLAILVRTSREQISRELKTLAQQALIHHDRVHHAVVLLDVDRLKAQLGEM